MGRILAMPMICRIPFLVVRGGPPIRSKPDLHARGAAPAAGPLGGVLLEFTALCVILSILGKPRVRNSSKPPGPSSKTGQTAKNIRPNYSTVIKLRWLGWE